MSFLWSSVSGRLVLIHSFLPPSLCITQAKRDAMFRDKVIVKDAEEKASAEPIVIARQLVLPLPRTYGEAAEWGTR